MIRTPKASQKEQEREREEGNIRRGATTGGTVKKSRVDGR